MAIQQNGWVSIALQRSSATLKRLNGPHRTHKVYGVTNPISEAPASKEETKTTELLMAELRARNTFEKADDARARCVRAAFKPQRSC